MKKPVEKLEPHFQKGFYLSFVLHVTIFCSGSYIGRHICIENNG